MKTISAALIAFFFFSIISFAQKITEDQVPLMVQKAFFLKYPDIKEAKWEIKDSIKYEATFKDNNTEQSVAFDKTGKWIQTESKIDTSLLPQKVTRVIFSHYGDYKSVSAKEIETFENGIIYEVIITNDKNYLKIKIKPNGDIMSRNAVKAEHD